MVVGLGLSSFAVCTTATVLTAFSMNPMWSFVCRFFTGAGIGGEYAATNSAIDELIPAKYRGSVDVAINGSFWVGAAAGSLLTIPLLDPTGVDPEWAGGPPSRSARSWRWASCWYVATAREPALLFIHGKEEESERIVSDIERPSRPRPGGSCPPLGTRSRSDSAARSGWD